MITSYSYKFLYFAQRCAGVIAFLIIFLAPIGVVAQTERSYHYDSVSHIYEVHRDTTVSVEERQTYVFVGEYHQGVRNIPHKALTAITDVEVLDGQTGRPLTYSPSQLDKSLPSSWGRYTTYEKHGQTYIEWYYDANNITRTWILRYTLHGTIAFYKEHDELYWNLFTDYTVPVNRAEATVRLPERVTNPTAELYTTHPHEYVKQMLDERTFYFSITNIAPYEAVTIAAGWQKGIVDHSAYWWGLLKIYWQASVALGMVFGAVIFSVIYGRIIAHRNRGRGTIIPQYEPPQNLRPAMAEVIAKGTITKKAWPATVVDLAVRGFIRIEEVSPTSLHKILTFLLYLAGGGLILVTLYFFGDGGLDEVSLLLLVVILIFAVVSLPFKLFKGTAPWQIKDYKLILLKDVSDATLERYESAYLRILFPAINTFSTKELRKSVARQQELLVHMDRLEKDLYKETQQDTQAFINEPKKTLISGFNVFFRLLLIIAIGLIFVVSAIQWWALGAGILAAGGIVYYAVFFRTRLNKKGHLLKEEWLGFKMYLETAEKLRLQNLTPELFEKYLPYAIIFGLEKKWARTFEPLHLQQPSWYAGSAIGYSGTGTSSFSPSDFSSAFSASFVSSFSSSGGGGASGGGGGAGGGGGGGGGGAS